MSSFSNSQINAAYIAYWQQINPKLNVLKTDGKSLTYQNETINIQGLYMQDLLRNSHLYHRLNSILPEDLFNIIRIHTMTKEIKEQILESKARRFEEYG